MTRIVECAESTLLLVIPEGSHVWRRFAAAPEKAQAGRRDDEDASDAAAAPLKPDAA